MPYDILQRDMIIFIIIYFGFLISTFKTDDSKKISGNVSPVVWDLLVVIITLAIIAAYAL